MNWLLVTQKPEEKNVPIHQQRLKIFYDHIPQAYRPVQTKDNYDHWEFTFGTGETSHIWFGATGSKELGQSATFHRVHWTEYSGAEPGDAENIETNLAGLPKNAQVVKESRPSGAVPPMFTEWERAKRGDSLYKPHIYPWFWEDEYRIDAAYLGREPALTEHEARLVSAHGLDLRQLAWRRFMVKRVGSEDRFLEQYIEDDATCFLVTGGQVFDGAYLRQLLLESRPPLSDSGGVRIYMPPKEGEQYVVGADPAEGLSGSNDSAATVRKARTWEHCAVVQGKFAPRDFAGKLVALAKMYSSAGAPALIAPERNNHGGTVIDVVMNVLEYPYVYLHDPMTGIGGGDGRFGFPVGTNKPLVVDALRQLVEERVWTSRDRNTIDQMMKYQEVSGKFFGEFDDLVSAEQMAAAARNQAIAMARTPRRQARAVHGGW